MDIQIVEAVRALLDEDLRDGDWFDGLARQIERLREHGMRERMARADAEVDRDVARVMALAAARLACQCVLASQGIDPESEHGTRITNAAAWRSLQVLAGEAPSRVRECRRRGGQIPWLGTIGAGCPFGVEATIGPDGIEQ